MLPSNLALVVLGSGEQRSRPSAVARALVATMAMASGFLVVFATFGLIVAQLASQAQRYLAGTGIATRGRRALPYINRIVGGLFVLVGLYVGYYGVYETRLYLGGGGASDPVVDARDNGATNGGRAGSTLSTSSRSSLH